MLEIRYKNGVEIGQRIVSRSQLPERRKALIDKGFRFIGAHANVAVKGSYKVRYATDRNEADRQVADTPTAAVSVEVPAAVTPRGVVPVATARVPDAELTPLQAKLRANREALAREAEPVDGITLDQFYDELRKHDWYFNFSDDHRYYVSGSKSLERIRKIAALSPEHTALFDAFHEHHFSGPSFGGGVQKSLPERPLAVAIPEPEVPVPPVAEVPHSSIRCRVRPISDARRSADFGEVVFSETEMLRREKEFAAKLAAEEEAEARARELAEREAQRQQELPVYLGSNLIGRAPLSSSRPVYTVDYSRIERNTVVSAAGPTSVLPFGTRRIPDGRYTVVFGDGHWRTLRFQTKTRGSMQGKTIVSYLSGPDNGSSYTSCAFYDQVEGRCSIWGRFRIPGTEALAEEILSAVGTILQNPSAAGEAYALRSGNCSRCGRTLTVPASIHRGLGPECARRTGWGGS